MNDKTAYPLCWPMARPRMAKVARKTNHNFKSSFAAARDFCMAEIRRLSGSDAIISSNINLKKNGEPAAVKWGESIPDPGVAVYFRRNSKELCFACDCWNHVQDNMQAIAKTIEALRGIARWGTGDMMEAAFTGFLALPAASAHNPFDVLGIPKNSSLEQAKDAYRQLAMKHHPDKGGNAEDFYRIKAAIDEIELLDARADHR